MKVKIAIAACTLALLAGCDDASIASRNLSQAADSFEVTRRIVFYNGITGDYMLSLEGRCSFDDAGTSRKIDVTCKTGPHEYKKHSLGLSDNVTYFSEQLNGADVSVYHYRVIFKPQSILPDVDFEGSSSALKNTMPSRH